MNADDIKRVNDAVQRYRLEPCVLTYDADRHAVIVTPTPSPKLAADLTEWGSLGSFYLSRAREIELCLRDAFPGSAVDLVRRGNGVVAASIS